MSSEFLKGLDNIDWTALGYPEMPNWIRNLASNDREVRRKATNQIGNIIAEAPSGAPENYVPISKLLKTELPIYITPFLIELLQNEKVQNKDFILQHLSDLATYPDLIEPTDAPIYKTRTEMVFEAVKKGIPVYELLLSDRDNEVQKMAKEVLEIIRPSSGNTKRTAEYYSLRVYVDYNSEGDDPQERGRISINTAVEKRLLDILRPNLPIILFDSESLEVDAVAEFDTEHQCWYGVPNWSTRRDLPPLSQEEMKRIRDLWSI